jgi:cell division GTPase FtsZ
MFMNDESGEQLWAEPVSVDKFEAVGEDKPQKPTPVKLPEAKEPAREISKVKNLEVRTMDVRAEATAGSIKDIKRSLDIGIIGVGGAGNKIADTFAEAGYDVMAVNLTDRDFAHLQNIPHDEFSRIELITTAGGAGKRPDVGAQAIDEYANTLMKKIQRKFNNKEFIYVCFGLGGGTGTLGGSKVAMLAASTGVPTGAIVTLPRTNEGTDEKVNCLRGLQEVANKKGLKSIVVIDNQRVSERLKDVKNSDFWHSANREIVNLFDSFNRYSAEAADTTFDAQDYKNVLMTPGFLSLGDSMVETAKVNGSGEAELAEAIRSIDRGFFATGFDHKTTIRAASVIIKPGKDTFDQSHSFEEALYNHLKEEIGAGGLNRGIYENKTLNEFVIVKTMLAGMRLPEARVQQLVTETKAEASEMAAKLNQRNTEVIGIEIPTDFGLIAGVEEEQTRKR